VAAKLGQTWPIPFDPDAMSATKSVTVSFTSDDRIDTQTVTVSAGQLVEVACALR
jgi:hypothetical protein